MSFTDAQATDIRRYADRLGISYAEQVRRIIDQWRINISGPPFQAGPGESPATSEVGPDAGIGPVTYQWFDRPKVTLTPKGPLGWSWDTKKKEQKS